MATIIPTSTDTKIRTLPSGILISLSTKAPDSQFTNIGPLTTTFTPPQSCDQYGIISHYGIIDGFSGQYTAPLYYVGLRGPACELHTLSSFAPDCLPPLYGGIYNRALEKGTTIWAASNTPASQSLPPVPYFSPGNACPVGFETACTMMATPSDYPLAVGITSWSRLGSHQIGIGCCPNGYICVNPDSLFCVSLPGIGESLSPATCSTSSAPSKVPYIPFVISAQTKGTIWAPRILYIQSDYHLTAPQRRTKTTTTQSSVSGSPNTGSEQSSGASSEGLSTPLKIAIGICISLGSILIGIAIFFYVRRQRRRNRLKSTTTTKEADSWQRLPSSVYKKSTEEEKGDLALSHVPELEGQSRQPSIYEMPGDGIMEAPADSFSPTELHAATQTDSAQKDETTTREETVENTQTRDLQVTNELQNPRFSFEKKTDS